MALIHAINGLNGEFIKWREPELDAVTVAVVANAVIAVAATRNAA
ncbi:hypothetical protein A2U01_0075876, partial [Trifolium medium]|nr:hypothetical protein [Trifolium medium]